MTNAAPFACTTPLQYLDTRLPAILEVENNCATNSIAVCFEYDNALYLIRTLSPNSMGALATLNDDCWVFRKNDCEGSDLMSHKITGTRKVTVGCTKEETDEIAMLNDRATGLDCSLTVTPLLTDIFNTSLDEIPVDVKDNLSDSLFQHRNAPTQFVQKSEILNGVYDMCFHLCRHGAPVDSTFRIFTHLRAVIRHTEVCHPTLVGSEIGIAHSYLALYGYVFAFSYASLKTQNAWISQPATLTTDQQESYNQKKSLAIGVVLDTDLPQSVLPGPSEGVGNPQQTTIRLRKGIRRHVSTNTRHKDLKGVALRDWTIRRPTRRKSTFVRNSAFRRPHVPRLSHGSSRIKSLRSKGAGLRMRGIRKRHGIRNVRSNLNRIPRQTRPTNKGIFKTSNWQISNRNIRNLNSGRYHGSKGGGRGSGNIASLPQNLHSDIGQVNSIHESEQQGASLFTMEKTLADDGKSGTAYSSIREFGDCAGKQEPCVRFAEDEHLKMQEKHLLEIPNGMHKKNKQRNVDTSNRDNSNGNIRSDDRRELPFGRTQKTIAGRKHFKSSQSPKSKIVDPSLIGGMRRLGSSSRALENLSRLTEKDDKQLNIDRVESRVVQTKPEKGNFPKFITARHDAGGADLQSLPEGGEGLQSLTYNEMQSNSGIVQKLSKLIKELKRETSHDDKSLREKVDYVERVEDTSISRKANPRSGHLSGIPEQDVKGSNTTIDSLNEGLTSSNWKKANIVRTSSAGSGVDLCNSEGEGRWIFRKFTRADSANTTTDCCSPACLLFNQVSNVNVNMTSFEENCCLNCNLGRCSTEVSPRVVSVLHNGEIQLQRDNSQGLPSSFKMIVI